MKSLTKEELETFTQEVQFLHGAVLQDVFVYATGVALGFWCERLYWLWIDLSPQCPQPLLLPGKTPRVKKLVKPLALFLKAHFKGETLQNIEVKRGYGRVLQLTLSSEGAGKSLEIRLFPHGQNLIAFSGGSHVAWSRIKDLPPSQNSEVMKKEESLNHSERAERWLAHFQGKSVKKETKEKDLTKLITKKQKAIEQMKLKLKERQAEPWGALGEWLKEHQNMAVPSEWERYIDRELSFADNIERCFTKVKDARRKQAGTEKRIQELETELADLKSGGGAAQGAQKTTKSLLEVSKAKGRTLRLNAHLVAYRGKSAQDNLQLLRKSQPWDYWLHLRDYPSSHAILSRPRKHEVTDRVLHQVGEWLAKESLGARGQKGDRLDIVVAECRHVRPLKGDRVGRVTYRDERVFTVELS